MSKEKRFLCKNECMLGQVDVFLVVVLFFPTVQWQYVISFGGPTLPELQRLAPAATCLTTQTFLLRNIPEGWTTFKHPGLVLIHQTLILSLTLNFHSNSTQLKPLNPVLNVKLTQKESKFRSIFFYVFANVFISSQPI